MKNLSEFNSRAYGPWDSRVQARETLCYTEDDIHRVITKALVDNKAPVIKLAGPIILTKTLILPAELPGIALIGAPGLTLSVSGSVSPAIRVQSPNALLAGFSLKPSLSVDTAIEVADAPDDVTINEVDFLVADGGGFFSNAVLVTGTGVGRTVERLAVTHCVFSTERGVVVESGWTPGASIVAWCVRVLTSTSGVVPDEPFCELGARPTYLGNVAMSIECSSIVSIFGGNIQGNSRGYITVEHDVGGVAITGNSECDITTTASLGINILAANTVTTKSLHATDIDGDVSGLTVSGAVANRIPYFLGSASVGGSANLQFNPTNNNLQVGSEAPASGDLAMFRKDQNAGTMLQLKNATTGTAAETGINLIQDGAGGHYSFVHYRHQSFAGAGLAQAGQLVLQTGPSVQGGILICSATGTSPGPIVLAVAGIAAANEKLRASNSGVIINEGAQTVGNFRVEGGADVNALNLDWSTGFTGFGRATALVKVDIDGAIALSSGSTTINSAAATLTVGNRSYIRLTLGASSSGTIVLSNGLQTGQLLAVECVSNAGTATLDHSTSNTVMPSTWTPVAGSLIEFVWNGADWVERGRNGI